MVAHHSDRSRDRHRSGAFAQDLGLRTQWAFEDAREHVRTRSWHQAFRLWYWLAPESPLSALLWWRPSRVVCAGPRDYSAARDRPMLFTQRSLGCVTLGQPSVHLRSRSHRSDCDEHSPSQAVRAVRSRHFCVCVCTPQATCGASSHLIALRSE